MRLCYEPCTVATLDKFLVDPVLLPAAASIVRLRCGHQRSATADSSSPLMVETQKRSCRTRAPPHKESPPHDAIAVVEPQPTTSVLRHECARRGKCLVRVAAK